MSMAALLQAVRDHLRAALNLDALACEVTPDGRPTPLMGEWYYAVHSCSTENGSNLNLDERYSLSVTVTQRTSQVPEDRLGQSILLDRGGILAAVDAARASLVVHRYDVMGAANALIEGTAEAVAAAGTGTATVNGFVEPLVYQGASYLGAKGPDWFLAEGDEGDAWAGLAYELRFARARRIQDPNTAT